MDETGLGIHFLRADSDVTAAEGASRAALVNAPADPAGARSALDAVDAPVAHLVATAADESGLGGYPAVADRLADDAVVHVPDPDPATAVEAATGESPAHEIRRLGAESQVSLGPDRRLTAVNDACSDEGPSTAVLNATAWTPGHEPAVSNAVLTPGLDPDEEAAALRAYAGLYDHARDDRAEFSPASESRPVARVVDQRHREDGSLGPLVEGTHGAWATAFGKDVEPTPDRIHGVRKSGVRDAVFLAYHGDTTARLGESSFAVEPETGSTALDDVPKGLAELLERTDDPPVWTERSLDGGLDP